MKRIFIFLLIMCAGSLSWAGVNTAAFLNVGVGARALGMGGAFTAIADDTSAAYWNPAGLGMMRKISLGSMIQQLGSVDYPTLENVSPDYQYINLVLPLKKIYIPAAGTISISLISSKLSKIPYTTLSSDGHVLRQEVTDVETAYILSYGRQVFIEGLSLGASIKKVSQKISSIADGSATGNGFELGLHYWVDEFIRFGFVTQSGVIMKWDNDHVDNGSLRNKAGAAYRVFASKRLSLLTSMDIIQMRAYPIEGHFGAELDYYCATQIKEFVLSKISLRTGINGIALEDRYNMQGAMNENLNWTLGLGINMYIIKTQISFDYALGSSILGDRHRISFSLYF